jgi:hypothetical protein
VRVVGAGSRSRHDARMPAKQSCVPSSAPFGFPLLLASALSFAAVACAQTPAPPKVEEPAPAVAPKAIVPLADLHGRIEDLGSGLRLLRIWGTPQQRGYAHGRLLADTFTQVALPEFQARFVRIPNLLVEARRALPRLIEYPEDLQQELDGLWQGLVDSGVPLTMQELGRAFDRTDLLLANALDVFGLMGCSGFTVWGERAADGGVLTARNFDWPLTGVHMLDHTLLVVAHDPTGRATASVAWPGYIGTVTGISDDGVAGFLHVGTGEITYLPEPSSWPTAIALRRILAHGAKGGDADAVFAFAKDQLGYTSPPAGYLTHVVLPTVPKGGVPLAVFETDSQSVVKGQVGDGPFVLTNHFRTRTDGRGSGADSEKREKQLLDGLGKCSVEGDHVVSVDEAWQTLALVERGGRQAFGTLHSLVFRHDPWCFELRIAELGENGKALVPATQSQRRYVLRREQVFPAGGLPGK